MAGVVGPGEGEALWMLNSLMTVRAGADETGGRFCLLEQILGPPAS